MPPSRSRDEDDETSFCEMVYESIAKIPRGKVSSYGDIAKILGYPGYARQVAKCLSKLGRRHSQNNSAVKKYKDLPWYRVVRSDMRPAFPPASQPYKIQIEKLAAEGIELVKHVKSAPGRIPAKYRL